jgi:hypothetical protein
MINSTTPHDRHLVPLMPIAPETRFAALACLRRIDTVDSSQPQAVQSPLGSLATALHGLGATI